MIPCKLCKEEFLTHKLQKAHMRSNHKKFLRNECEFCENKYSCATTLWTHIFKVKRGIKFILALLIFKKCLIHWIKKTVSAIKRTFEYFVQSIAFCSRSIKSSNPSNVKSVEKTSAVSPFSNNIRERDTRALSLTNATSAVGRMKITFYFKVISKNI